MKARLFSVLMLAAAATPLAAQQLSNAPSRLTPEPFTETVFGIQVHDPYRWTERADRAAEVTKFIRHSSAPTVASLQAMPGYAGLRSAIDEASQAGVRYGDVRSAGGRLFYRRTDAGAQLAKLVVRMPDSMERVLYDPDKPNGGLSGAINSYSVSPSGRTVAIHTAGGGAEVGAVHFIDAATGRLLSDTLEPVWSEFEVEWIDDTTFAYTRMNSPAGGGGDAMRNMTTHVRRLGGADGPALLGGGAAASPDFAAQDFPLIEFEPDSRWAIGFAAGARADVRVLAADRASVVAGGPAWREVASIADRIGATELDGDILYAISTKRNPNGEVIAVDLNKGESARDGRVVVSAGPLILSAIEATPSGLYILGQIDGLSRLLFLAKGAATPAEVILPMRGLAGRLREIEGSDDVTFTMQDWFTAARWFRATKTTVKSLGLDSASYAVAGARQIRETARSADGTDVPLDIVLPPGADAKRPLPVLLEGYGSYGVNTAEPYYLGYALGMLKQGGALAYCGTRGGGERGRSWHEGGRAANKPNAHADLIACAERLIALGWTSPARLTVTGTSAGGLLAPPAALKRPDLFTALIANVAILNPTRLGAANNGANQFGEMGDPNTPEGYRSLLAQDSYEMLKDANDVPDTLIVIGLNDHRVDPWMSAKFAARGLDRFGNRRLMLIRTDPNAGHAGIGSTRSQLVDQFSDMFAFVLNQAGAQNFATPEPARSPGPGH